MGSTGSGSFSDYQAYGKAEKGFNGGEDFNDKCSLSFETFLEEVETSDYYREHAALPRVKSEVTILFKTRIAAIDNSGVVMGYLPTKYNYINGCLREGYMYSGEVTLVKDAPIKSVKVSITSNKL